MPNYTQKGVVDNRKSARYGASPPLKNEADRPCAGYTTSALDHQPSHERMKVMLNLNSARLREETPHSTNGNRTTTSDVLKRRAQAVIHDKTIDARTRALVRYGVEINDPDLPELVRRADNGESIFDNMYLASSEEKIASSEEKIEVLTDLICRAGDEPSVALLVLLSTLENSTHPKALANTAKHFAFTHCAELNLHGMVDAQIGMLEANLFPHGTPRC
jgi:hypothetical protein